MERVIAEDKDKDMRLVLITFEGDGNKKVLTFNKSGEAVHMTISDLFMLQKLVNLTCSKFLNDRL